MKTSLNYQQIQSSLSQPRCFSADDTWGCCEPNVNGSLPWKQLSGNLPSILSRCSQVERKPVCVQINNLKRQLPHRGLNTKSTNNENVSALACSNIQWKLGQSGLIAYSTNYPRAHQVEIPRILFITSVTVTTMSVLSHTKCKGKERSWEPSHSFKKIV